MKPLIDPDHAAKLLDEVLYACVAELFDFAGLFELEQQLWTALNAAGLPEPQIGDIATAMIDQALRRLPEDVRRTGGFVICALCDEEARAAKRRAS